MPHIIPVSDPKNYGEVLRRCANGHNPLTARAESRVEPLRKEGGLSLEEAFAGLEDL